MHDGPEDEDDGWFDLDPEEQQAIRDTWDPEDHSPLDELFDPIDAEDEDEEEAA